MVEVEVDEKWKVISGVVVLKLSVCRATNQSRS